MRKVHLKPCEWLKEDSGFGKGEPTDWKPASTTQERAELAAAKVQHRVMRAVRGEKGKQGKRTADLADEIGMSAEGLRRLLRGQAHMSPYHALALGDVLGIDIRTTITKRH